MFQRVTVEVTKLLLIGNKKIIPYLNDTDLHSINLMGKEHLKSGRLPHVKM